MDKLRPLTANIQKMTQISSKRSIKPMSAIGHTKQITKIEIKKPAKTPMIHQVSDGKNPKNTIAI
jgi:hypothetical protein